LEAALETFVDVATGFDAIGASSARRAGVDADADDDDDDAAPSPSAFRATPTRAR
jgi:hypothetical protein